MHGVQFQHQKSSPAVVHGSRLSNPRTCHTKKIPKYPLLIHGINAWPVRQNENDPPPISPVFPVHLHSHSMYRRPGHLGLALKHGFSCDHKGMHGSKSMLSQTTPHSICLCANNYANFRKSVAFQILLNQAMRAIVSLLFIYSSLVDNSAAIQ